MRNAKKMLKKEVLEGAAVHDSKSRTKTGFFEFGFETLGCETFLL